ncbi:MAG: glucose 1-dehydrogenase, partial [Pseudomonadota bacterium]
MQLSGKTALVTGAASGFGAGIAHAFSAAGAAVMVADINADGARDAAMDLGGHSVEVDVADAASVQAMAKHILDAFGHLDILVNNAGITHLPQSMEDVSEDEFDRVFAVNAKSVYLSARSFVPHFKERKAGVILNIASTAGVSPRPNLNWYNASKGWMITATKAMAVELAPHGIRVQRVDPN